MLGLLLWGSPIFLFSFCQQVQVSPCFLRSSKVALGNRVSKSPPAMIGGVRRSREGVDKIMSI